MEIEGTEQYQAAAFEEGHYLQVEVAAKLKTSKNAQLADDFLNFMVSEGFQKHLPLSNVMYPVNTPAEMPAAYSKLIKPTKVLQLDTAEINQNRKQWVNDWLNVMTQ
jgi:thiamine transport system substrate-binding protein